METVLFYFVCHVFFFHIYSKNNCFWFRCPGNAVFLAVLGIIYLKAFPKDDNRQRQWISAINRKDFFTDSSVVVCVTHFEERFVIEEDKFPQKGSIITIQKKKLALAEDALAYNFSKPTSLFIPTTS